MTEIRRGRGITMLVVGMVIGAFAFGASSVLASNPHENRPFQGTLEGSSAVTGPATGGFAATSTGTINATHIGNGEYVLESTQDYARHEGEVDHPEGDCGFVDGTFDITAANGDVLNGELDGDRSVVCVLEEFAGPGTDVSYLSTLYINVVGGSGRFSDATGWLFSRGTSTADLPPSGTTFADSGIVLGDIDY